MFKKMKAATSIAMAAILSCASLSVRPDTTEAAAKVKKMALNKTRLTMDVGDRKTIKVKMVTPKKASKAALFKSSRKKVATVSKKGVVYAKRAGRATITVTAKTNKKVKKTVGVTVKSVKRQNAKGARNVTHANNANPPAGSNGGNPPGNSNGALTTAIPNNANTPAPAPRYIYRQRSEMVTRWYDDGYENGHHHSGYKNNDFAIWIIGLFDNDYDSTDDENVNNGISAPVLNGYMNEEVTVKGEFMYEGHEQSTILLQLSYYLDSKTDPVVWRWEKGASATANEYASYLNMEGVNGSENASAHVWTDVNATFTIPYNARGNPIMLYFPNKPRGTLPYRSDNTFHFRNFEIKLGSDKDPGSTAMPTNVPTNAPTSAPTHAPTPSPTPTNVPRNTDTLNAVRVAYGTSIAIDGKEGAGEAWEDVAGSPVEILNETTKAYGIRGGSLKATSATAKFMWDDTSLYALVNVTGAADDETLTVYVADSHESYSVSKVEVKPGHAGRYGAAVKTDTGYVAEVKVPLYGKTAGDSAAIDIQLTEGNVTANYFDTPHEMVYDEASDSWIVADDGVKAGEDASVLGTISLNKALEQPTSAYYTDQEDSIIKAAAFEKADPVYDADDTELANELYPAHYNMAWVGTKYWTDAYEANYSPSILFAHGNVPDYAGNADMVTLFDPVTGESTRDKAQAYTIWSENYLYILYDVNDPDIAPASADHYLTDSVEFFLDEDFDRPDVYSEDTDEVQIRVDAADKAFTCKNDASESADGQPEGTKPFDMIATAVKYKHGNVINDTVSGAAGYMVEMIIKFQNPHSAGNIMGMDLQINDCFTSEEYVTDPDTGEETTALISDRAGTLTAYDETNDAYENPSCFGRIKLAASAPLPEPTATPAPEAASTPTPEAVPTPAPEATATPAADRPTEAYYTSLEEEMLSAANPQKAEPVYVYDSNLDQSVELYPAHYNMTWVDTAYWTNVYAANEKESILFSHCNIPDYKGNADRVTLFDPATGLSTREQAQAYTVWSENYLYVLYDINDHDIAPASTHHYDTDSVEFFLDENNERPDVYGPDTDEVQIRVDAIDGTFSCKNDSEHARQPEGTDPFKMIATAVKYKHGTELNDSANGATGYMVEMIIKFQNPHSAGSTMGMDLQINDCFTSEESETDPNTGEVTATIIPDRAGTLTAYDETNEAYENPSCFGKIELVASTGSGFTRV